MEETRPQYKTLPIEVLQEIFQLGKRQQLFSCALVCKAWEIPAQSVLYSNVEIKSLLQLKKFYAAVKRKSQLGDKVKTFKLNISTALMDWETRKNTIADSFYVLSNLLSTCLPNLEVLRDSTVKSYIPILNALEDSQLKQLSSIDLPSDDSEQSEVANYTTCALYLKDRITRINIKENYKSEQAISTERLNAKRLYEQLHRFKNLLHIDLHMKTAEEIQIIEHILKTCETLMALSFSFETPKNEADPPNDNVSIDAITNVNPAHNVSTVIADVNVERDYKLLLYVMHKFPKLNRLVLSMEDSSPAPLNRQILAQLLKYSTEIKSFCGLRFQIDDHNVFETIAEHWRSAVAPGTQRVDVIYSEETAQEEIYRINFIRNSGFEVTTFTYPILMMGHQYIDLMEKGGEFIRLFQFTMAMEEFSDRPYLPSDFMPNIFMHCRNLEALHITQFTLTRLSHSRMDLRNKLSLKELFFNRCVLNSDALEQLSILMPDIKTLMFGCLVDDTVRTQQSSLGDPDIEIIMPYTNIDRILFEEFNHLEKPVYFKIFALDSQSYSYYRYHRDYRISSEQNYTNATDCIRAYICCKSKPKIDVVII